MTGSRRRRAWIAAAVAALLVVGAAGAGVVWWKTRDELAGVALPSPTPIDVRLYVDPRANVVRIAAEDPRFAELAAVPQAKWFTGWSTIETARADVAGYVGGAASAGRVPALVLYQIP